METKEFDWSNLGFGYHKTNYNVRCYYRDGNGAKWKSAPKKTSICTWLPPACTTDRRLSKD